MMIFGVMLLAVASGLIVNWKPELFMVVLLADLWLLGYHHVIITFTKLAGTRQDRKDNKFLIYYLPFIVLASVALIYNAIGAIAIVTIYFFWQWFHYTRQAYGISTFYRRKSGIEASSTPVKLDYAAIWAIPIWGIVHRCSQDLDSFLFLPLWTPDIPTSIDAAIGSAAVLITAAWLITKLCDWKKGNIAYAPFFFVLSHHITFFVGYIYIKDVTIGWLVANIWHNAQYILFVWLFNQNRFQNTESREKAPVLHWLCQRNPYRTIAYFAACLAVTTIIYQGLSTGIEIISADNAVRIAALTVILYQTINFHHYIVDGLIWKARKKSHQKIMKIKT
jgi:hypothetical protein